MAHISGRKKTLKSAFSQRLAFRRPISRLKTFASDEDGAAMSILAMFLFVVMLIVSGLAIDMMKYELHRMRLQATLDRAILAAAHPDQYVAEDTTKEAARKAVVLDYFKRAGLEDTIDADRIEVLSDHGQNRVEAKASLTVGTPFLNLIGLSSLSAPASGVAEKGVSLVEISLVLDVSGSMGDPNNGKIKLTELKRAATEFSNLLLCNPGDASTSTDCTITQPKTSISIVPYAAYVNAGDELLQAFDPIGPHNRNSCVTFSEESYSKIGVMPTPETHELALMTDDDKRDFLMHQSTAAMVRRWVESYTQINTGSYRKSPYWENRTPCHKDTETWREIKPFQHSAETVKSIINGFYASGNTSIEMGLKWGTTLLNHAAQPVIEELSTAKPILDADGDPVLDADGGPMMTTPMIDAAFKGRPFDPNNTASRKIVVLMTDGQNTTSIEMEPEARSGDSPFWVTKTEARVTRISGAVGVKSNENVLSIYRPDTGKYIWHYVVEDDSGGMEDVVVNNAADHPFGTVATDCLSKTYQYYDDWGWFQKDIWNVCAGYTAPAAQPTKLTYQQFWGEEGYHVDFVSDQFDWLLGDGQIIKVYGAEKNLRTKAQCQAAKDAGIIIVSIDMSSGNSVLKTCASTASLDGSAKATEQYHKVSTTNISATFKKIANDINKLRLTE